MKKLIVACIDQILEFDDIASFDRHINNLNGRIAYKIMKQVVRSDGSVIVRIKRQYNTADKFMEMDGEKYL